MGKLVLIDGHSIPGILRGAGVDKFEGTPHQCSVRIFKYHVPGDRR